MEPVAQPATRVSDQVAGFCLIRKEADNKAY
jgi:hypothetical protein